MKNNWLVIMAFLAACQSPATSPKDGRDDTAAGNETASALQSVRDNPKKEAVANYKVKLPEGINDWYFKVALFETTDRFVYRLHFQYQEIIADDSVRLPNLGEEPRPILQRGKNDLECIIGFLDNKNTFRPYKMVGVKNDQLKLSTIKQYAVYAR